MTKELSIIIPVYNEINLIDKFLKKLFNEFDQSKTKFIIIDDGSNDGSNKYLEKNVSNLIDQNNFKLILLKKNYGKGYAVRQGMKEVEGDYFLLIDSDLEYDPKDALELYLIAKKNDRIDVIHGSRYLGGKIQLRQYFFNDLAARFNTYIFNIFFSQSITDLHTGLRVMKSSLIKDLKLTLNGFGLEIDLSSEIVKKNYNIFEYGISYFERTKSQGKKITIIDGLLSYYFLFKTRFLQNDNATLYSILYSFCFMTYAGTYFGMGTGKIFMIIIFMIIGLSLGINRKIIPLSIIFLGMYLGSLFSAGNGRIYPVLIFFLITLIISKKITNNYKNKKKGSVIKFLL